MKKQYILMCSNPANDFVSNIFSDLFKSNKIKCCSVNKKKIKNIFLKAIQRVHLSYKISKVIKLPLKKIWYDFSEFEFNDIDEYYIIVTTNLFFDYDISIFKELSKHKNVKLVLILWDTVGVDTPVGRKIAEIYKYKIWNYIFSYDINDAKKHNFHYLNEHYYSKPQIEENVPITSDAYFIGGLKPGRVNENVELFEYLKKNGINAKFDIVKNDGRTLDYSAEGFRVLNKRQPYLNIAQEVQSTNCIIEFLQKGQHAQSLRYFEAVCFNKKLLTNNENVKNLKYYNEKYMKVFSNFEDIDIEWVKTKEQINYGYNGEFSPLYIIDEIEKLEKK